jgi:adenylate cyclase
MLRFRRLSFRLLAMLLGLLFAIMAVTYTLVSRANEQNAYEHAVANLELGVRVFDNATQQIIESLAAKAGVMTGDYAIRQVLLQDKPDAATLGSILQSYTQRVGAPVVVLFTPEGTMLAGNEIKSNAENRGPFEYLIRLATKGDLPLSSGISYQDKNLHVLVVVPLYAPYPNIADWFGLAFPLDGVFAGKIKATTRLELTFVATEDPFHPRVLASTLKPDEAQIVAKAAAAQVKSISRIDVVALPSERYVTLFRTQEMLGENPITVVLQRPLSAELAAADELENELLLISLAALAAATLVAFWIARDVSLPVSRLAHHTLVIARGDYAARIHLARVDELGQLAESFNTMSTGLAERDRVRDLLDKNVSPEVAEQLMRDGAALGGEEREVTILFADLRGFTTLSEQLKPPELLALLNRYLDRMSAEIERQGGVIDKYIGDAIMALFGAPVTQANAADRALLAALAMEKALVKLNAELATEGRAPLAIGVGINTARVVAGNIGSHRRLNYSVIGDGVNVASRLQSLTRTAEYRTNVITSAATLAAARGKFAVRELGAVTVKGRAEPVQVFAVDGSV